MTAGPTTPFTWEQPPSDVYETKWFPPAYRARLDAEPGRWGRIARDAHRAVPTVLRERFPDYEFKAHYSDQRRTRSTIYARRRAEA